MFTAVVIVLLALFAFPKQSDTIILTSPRNTVSIIGSNSTLRCRTNDTVRFSWTFTNTSGNVQASLYDGTMTNPDYVKRGVSVSADDNGSRDIHFQNIDFSSAGTYTCQDGQAKAAWIAILDAKPNCTFTKENATCLVTMKATWTPSVKVRPQIDLSPTCSPHGSSSEVIEPNRTSVRRDQWLLKVSVSTEFTCPSFNISFNADTTETTIDRQQPDNVFVIEWPTSDESSVTDSTINVNSGHEDSVTRIGQNGGIFLSLLISIFISILIQHSHESDE